MTLALLGSYTVQATLGDYDSAEHGGTTEYLRDFVFSANQNEELLEKVAELHKSHKYVHRNCLMETFNTTWFLDIALLVLGLKLLRAIIFFVLGLVSIDPVMIITLVQECWLKLYEWKQSV